MNEFVDECRKEWRRLGVQDSVANEMAAELTTDLAEAEDEGDSAEDVLGNNVFDPRQFAAAWADARGVTGPPIPDRPSRWQPRTAIILTALFGVLAVGAGLVLLVAGSGHSIAFAVHRVVGGTGPIRFFVPGPGRAGFAGPLSPPFVGTQIRGVVLPLAWMLLVVGIVGLGLLAVVYWLPWSGDRRRRRDRGGQDPGWN